MPKIQLILAIYAPGSCHILTHGPTPGGPEQQRATHRAHRKDSLTAEWTTKAASQMTAASSPPAAQVPGEGYYVNALAGQEREATGTAKKRNCPGGMILAQQHNSLFSQPVSPAKLCHMLISCSLVEPAGSASASAAASPTATFSVRCLLRLRVVCPAILPKHRPARPAQPAPPPRGVCSFR